MIHVDGTSSSESAQGVKYMTFRWKTIQGSDAEQRLMTRLMQELRKAQDMGAEMVVWRNSIEFRSYGDIDMRTMLPRSDKEFVSIWARLHFTPDVRDGLECTDEGIKCPEIPA